MIGTPSDAKKRGVIARNRARASSSPAAFVTPSAANWNPGPKPALRAARDAHAARAARRNAHGQRRYVRQDDRGDQREADADPHEAEVHGEIQRADREARRVAGENRDHRPRDQSAEERAGAA